MARTVRTQPDNALNIALFGCWTLRDKTGTVPRSLNQTSGTYPA